jgi:hypothetical protein
MKAGDWAAPAPSFIKIPMSYEVEVDPSSNGIGTYALLYQFTDWVPSVMTDADEWSYQ